MTYPPGQSSSVRDGGIGLVSTQKALPLVIGVTSLGVADTLYQYTDQNKCRDEQGFGPAVELGLPVIQATGGCLLLKTQASTAGSNGSVTPTRIGTSTGTITVAGTPRDSYKFVAIITVAGTVGAGKFKYSLDNGYTYTESITIPGGAAYVIPNTGLTITFVPGAGAAFFDVGDKHVFASTAPLYTTSNLSSAITALLAQIGARRIRRVFFAGKHASAANAATMAAAIATHMATLQAAQYNARAMMDMGQDTAANVLTAFASFANARVTPVFGNADLVSLNGFAGWGIPTVPALNVAAERAASADLSENLGRKESGPARGVRAISDNEGTNTQFSEADKVTTLRTYRGESGFFITNGYLKSPSGSDFQYWDWGCTIDEICETIQDAEKRWVLKKLRALADGTGKLDSRDAVRMEAAVRAALKAKIMDPTNIEGFKGHVSALSYNVDRTNDYLSTRTLLSSCSAVPLPPAETITSQVGFARSVA